MKTIIIYAKRNVGMCVIPYVVAKGYSVKVISDDVDVLWVAGSLGLEIVTLDNMGDFDWFICVHGTIILKKEQLKDGKMLNVHPCLFKYKGRNPIKRYILNEDEYGSVEVQYMVEKVDAGEVIHREDFYTGKVNTFEAFYNIALPFYFKAVDGAFKKLMI